MAVLQKKYSHFFKSWTNGIRTHNDRTKTCSVTITPWSNPQNLRLQRYGLFFILPNFYPIFFCIKLKYFGFSYIFVVTTPLFV